MNRLATAFIALTPAFLGCAASPALGGRRAAVSLDSGNVQLPRVSGAHLTDVRGLLVPAAGTAGDDRVLDALERCASGRDPVGLLPLRVASITARPGGALLASGDAAGVVSDDGTLPGKDRRGQLITPLYDALLAMSEDEKALSARGCDVRGEAMRDSIALVLDERLPFETVRAILYTAGQVGFTSFYLVVDDASASPSPHPTTRPGPGPADVVIQGPWGYDVRSAHGFRSRRLECTPQPCGAGGWPIDSLRQVLAELHAADPEVESLTLLPDASVPYAALTATLAAVDQGPHAHVVLAGDIAGESDLPILAPAAPPGPRPAPRQVWTDAVPTLRFALPLIDARHAAIDQGGGTAGALRDAFVAGSAGTGPGSADGEPGPVEGLGFQPDPTPAGGVVEIDGAPHVVGDLPRAHLDDVVGRHLEDLRRCYLAELATDPKLAGEATIKFVLANDGSVSSAHVLSTTLGAPEVEACVARRFTRMRFDAPETSGMVIVRYPLRFRPTATRD